MKLKLTVLIVILFHATLSAQARFAYVETQQVPIDRLLKNLTASQSKAKDNAAKAMLEFQIGRLLSMAYALKTEEAPVRKETDPSESIGTVFYGYSTTDYNQFRAQPAKNATQEASAQSHLQEAIAHLRKAVQLDGNLLPAKLGLAWCLDQAGKKTEALGLYRDVLRAAWTKEEKSPGGFIGSSAAMETADYLTKLLDPQKDSKELADLKSKTARLDLKFRAITPIVVPLSADARRSELMHAHQVVFDLDGRGKRRYGAWPTNKAGWLVYDASNSRTITSGLQLFGQSTFWIFWRDGYQALAALDDNRDGKIDGSELRGLAIWQDINQNGVSEPNEVQSLAAWKIQALSFDSSPDKDGMLKCDCGVTFLSGRTNTTVDWIVEQFPVP